MSSSVDLAANLPWGGSAKLTVCVFPAFADCRQGYIVIIIRNDIHEAKAPAPQRLSKTLLEMRSGFPSIVLVPIPCPCHPILAVVIVALVAD